ncbi:MAG: GNAT family N-acetyltransferase [Bacteroidota bacterium]|nr:GNAT family N-acetyltransferase [Bacteroidota bacterium]
MEIRIAAYEEWMKPQIAELFSVQYNVPAADFSTLMDNFYDHPYQKEKCIRIAALEGEKVIGFQSFFYWPYNFKGMLYNSFQSGNSLVHPEYRGKRIFQQLLNYLGEHREKFGIDFLVGFPINASRNSLLRNGWKNILDLEWFVSSANPLRSLFGNEHKKLSRHFKQAPDLSLRENADEGFRLSLEKEFLEWRKCYSVTQHYFYHVYKENGKSIEFTLKPSRRKKIIRELVIGNVHTENNDSAFLRNAFRDLRSAVKKSGAAAFLSLACNPHAASLSPDLLAQVSFRRIDKKIFFTVKTFSGQHPAEEPSNWILFRSDIDTW